MPLPPSSQASFIPLENSRGCARQFTVPAAEICSSGHYQLKAWIKHTLWVLYVLDGSVSVGRRNNISTVVYPNIKGEKNQYIYLPEEQWGYLFSGKGPFFQDGNTPGGRLPHWCFGFFLNWVLGWRAGGGACQYSGFPPASALRECSCRS